MWMLRLHNACSDVDLTPIYQFSLRAYEWLLVGEARAPRGNSHRKIIQSTERDHKELLAGDTMVARHTHLLQQVFFAHLCLYGM